MKYRNIKTGNTYTVLEIAIDATNDRKGQRVVIYYPDNYLNIIFVREENEFREKFEEIL